MSYTLTVEPDVVRSAEACASRCDIRVVDVPDSVKAISGIISLPDGADEAKIVHDAIMSN